MEFFFFFLGIILLCGLYTYFYNRKIRKGYIKIKRYFLDTTKKIVFFSDTHFGTNYSEDNLEKISDLINAEKPDYVFFLGDLFDRFNSYKKGEAFVSEELNKIKSKYGNFAIIGNHDEGRGDCADYKRIIKNGGFTLLVNETYINEDFSVTGIDEAIYGSPNFRMGEELKNTAFSVLLSHEPDLAQDMEFLENFSLVLSGHTHKAQINMPILRKFVMPYKGKKFFYGMYNLGKTKIIVSSGVGVTRIPIRFFADPEIVVIDGKRL